VARLIDLGITQQAMTRRLGTNKSRLSRWLNEKREIELTVGEMDRLEVYLREIHAASEPLGLVGNPVPEAPPKSTGSRRP
jgi:transcriptional regulator with XRE-family HTH domain